MNELAGIAVTAWEDSPSRSPPDRQDAKGREPDTFRMSKTVSCTSYARTFSGEDNRIRQRIQIKRSPLWRTSDSRHDLYIAWMNRWRSGDHR